MSTKVTIMIPCYNQEHLVGFAVESALNQTYQNLEVIIADDNSTDATSEVVKQYLQDPRVRYVRNQPNLGRVKNYRHTLYELATGDYVLNIDGDDYLSDPNYLAEAVEVLDANPDMSLVFGKIKYLFADGTEYEGKTDNTLSAVSDGNQVLLSYFERYFIPHLSSLYRRKLAMEIGFYTLDQAGCDLDSLLRLLVNHKVGYIDKFVGVWRRHEANASQIFETKPVVGNLQIVTNVYDFAISHSSVTKPVWEVWKQRSLSRFVIKALLKAQYFGGTKLAEFKQAISDFDPQLYSQATASLKYKLLSVVFRSRLLTKLVLVYVLNLESMYRDLEEIRNGKSK